MFMLIFGLSFFFVPLAAGQCYDQNKNIVGGDLACDTGSQPTFCCPASAACLSNGLCTTKDQKLFIGSCTDKSWPQECERDCPSESGVTACPDAGQFCCTTGGAVKKGSDKCCSSGNIFTLVEVESPATLPFVKSVTSSSLKSSPTSKGQSSSSSSGSSSARTTLPSTTLSSATSLASTTDLAQSSTTSTQSTQTAIPVAAAAPSMSLGAKIGAGIGGVFGVTALGLSIFAIMFYLRRRRQDKLNAERLAAIRAKAESNEGRSVSNRSNFSAAGSIARRPIASNYAPAPMAHMDGVLPYTRSVPLPESEHLLSHETPVPYDIPPQAAMASTSSPAPRPLYRAYSSTPSSQYVDNHELGFPEEILGQSHQQRVPSFSALVNPDAGPSTMMTPAEELAAARARTNMMSVPEEGALRGSNLRRQVSAVSSMSRPMTEIERDRTTLSRANSDVSGPSESVRSPRH